MFDAFKIKQNPNGDNPVILPGYHRAPSNPSSDNLKYYEGVLATGAGSVSTVSHAVELFGMPAQGFNTAVAIRPYRARVQTPSPPYFYPG